MPAAAQGIALIRLAAPTTPGHGCPGVLEGASGQSYAVSITGVTGTASAAEEQVAALVAISACHTRCRSRSDSASTRRPRRRPSPASPTVVVGSAIVRRVEQAIAPDGTVAAGVADRVAGFVAELAAGVNEAERAMAP